MKITKRQLKQIIKEVLADKIGPTRYYKPGETYYTPNRKAYHHREPHVRIGDIVKQVKSSGRSIGPQPALVLNIRKPDDPKVTSYFVDVVQDVGNGNEKHTRGLWDYTLEVMIPADSPVFAKHRKDLSAVD